MSVRSYPQGKTSWLLNNQIRSSNASTRQSEMTDTRSLWRTCDVIMHVFITAHVWRRRVFWWHVLSYFQRLKNRKINHLMRNPIRIIWEGHSATGMKYFLFRKIKSIWSNRFWVTRPDRHTDIQTCRQTYTDAIPSHSCPVARITRLGRPQGNYSRGHTQTCTHTHALADWSSLIYRSVVSIHI